MKIKPSTYQVLKSLASYCSLLCPSVKLENQAQPFVALTMSKQISANFSLLEFGCMIKKEVINISNYIQLG